MKYFVIMSVSLMLIANCCFSQAGYPKSAIIDKDSVVLITPLQVRDLNLYKVDCDEWQETAQEQLESLVLKQEQIVSRDTLIKNLKAQVSLGDERLNLAQVTLTKIGDTALRQDRRIDWLKLQRTGLAAGLLGAIVYILISR